MSITTNSSNQLADEFKHHLTGELGVVPIQTTYYRISDAHKHGGTQMCWDVPSQSHSFSKQLQIYRATSATNQNWAEYLNALLTLA